MPLTIVIDLMQFIDVTASNRFASIPEEINASNASPQHGKDMADLSDVAVCEDGCLLISIQNQLVKMTLDGLVLASVGKRGE